MKMLYCSESFPTTLLKLGGYWLEGTVCASEHCCDLVSIVFRAHEVNFLFCNIWKLLRMTWAQKTFKYCVQSLMVRIAIVLTSSSTDTQPKGGLGQGADRSASAALPKGQLTAVQLVDSDWSVYCLSLQLKLIWTLLRGKKKLWGMFSSGIIPLLSLQWKVLSRRCSWAQAFVLPPDS